MARVENKTWMVTTDKYQTMCHVPEGVEPIMGHWMSPETFAEELDSRFPGCMAGGAITATILNRSILKEINQLAIFKYI